MIGLNNEIIVCKIYTAEELFSLNQTDEILQSKAKKLNKHFYHYTTIDSANNILFGDERGNHFFFMSNLINMNDLNESKLHDENGNRLHCFCSCCTDSEKIPLWYLYSGICGNGVRLGFTAGKMINFLNSINVIYPVKNNKTIYTKPLKINEDFDMSCGWIFYLDNDKCKVIYKNTSYIVESMNEEILKNNFFVKNYPWKYEHEFRIIIKNKTDELFEKVALPIPSDLVSELEIMFAPECILAKEEAKRYVSKGIKHEKIKKSKLSINMDLLNRNRNDILNRMDAWCGEEQCLDVCTYVQSKKKCVQKV